MLRDRIALLEQEIRGSKIWCGEMYKEISIHGRTDYQGKYDLELDRLSKLMTEHIIIKEMIDGGQP